jgi:hypothetical protein
MGKWQETVGEGFGTAKHKGEKKKIPVTDELKGGIGGYHVEHWDGSQDAIITPQPIAASARAQEGA